MSQILIVICSLLKRSLKNQLLIMRVLKRDSENMIWLKKIDKEIKQTKAILQEYEQ